MSAILDALNTLAADNVTAWFRLSAMSQAVLFYATRYWGERFNWIDSENPLDEVTDSDWEEISFDVAQLLYEAKIPMIGYIIPFVTLDPPTNVLPCDGSTYLRIDYPNLYDVIDPFFIVDADHFNVPDLRGRTVIGVGAGSGLTNRNVGDSGGQETVTLTTADMPSHNHTSANPTIVDAGHSHAEGTALPTAITIGAGVPAPSAIPSVGVTSPAFTGITAIAGAIDNTGGDGAHDNMQPFYSLNYGIIAS